LIQHSKTATFQQTLQLTVNSKSLKGIHQVQSVLQLISLPISSTSYSTYPCNILQSKLRPFSLVKKFHQFLQQKTDNLVENSIQRHFRQKTNHVQNSRPGWIQLKIPACM